MESGQWWNANPGQFKKLQKDCLKTNLSIWQRWLSLQ
jgi:hypothetical protein